MRERDRSGVEILAEGRVKGEIILRRRTKLRDDCLLFIQKGQDEVVNMTKCENMQYRTQSGR